MHGDGKTRLYPGVWALSHSDRNRAMSWFYLGQGWPAHHHETLLVIATMEYRLPLVIMDIALDPAGRGVYECKSRRLGRHLSSEFSRSLSTPETPINVVDPEYGGMVRYSYCTLDFIMGTLMLENRPSTALVPSSIISPTISNCSLRSLGQTEKGQRVASSTGFISVVRLFRKQDTVDWTLDHVYAV